MPVPSRLVRIFTLCFMLLSTVRAVAEAPLLVEREPNDTESTAFQVEAPVRVEGQLTRGDTDLFNLRVDDDASTQLFDLALDGGVFGPVTATISLADTKAPAITLTTTASTPTARSEGALLMPGRYVVAVRGADGPYSLSITNRVLRPVVIPNDRERARADRLANTTAAAYFLPDNDAWLKWAPGAGRYDVAFRVLGEAVIEVAIEDKAGAVLRSARGNGVSLAGLDLGAGEHFFRIRGPEATYVAALVRPLNARGEPPLLPLAVGKPASGQIEPRVDRVHRVRVPAQGGLFRARAVGDGVKKLLWSAPNGQRLIEARAEGQGASAAATLEGIALPPGDQRFTVSGGPGRYTLTLEPMAQASWPGAPGPAAYEREPNGGGNFLDSLHFDDVRAGYLSATTDGDVFDITLPTDTAVVLSITAVGQPLKARLVVEGSGHIEQWDVTPESPVVFTGELGGGEYMLELSPGRGATAGGSYTLKLAHGDPFSGATGPALPTVSVALKAATVAAHAPSGQTLRGELVVGGSGTVMLSARSTDPKWVVVLPRSSVALSAGQRVTVPFEVHVAPDVAAGRPVRFDIGARLGDSAPWAAGHATAVAAVAASPVAPSDVWPLPDALLGGLNVARGGVFVDATGNPLSVGSRTAPLIEGFARRDRPFEVRLAEVATLASMPTVRLAGDRAYRIAGFIFETVGPDLRSALRGFRVWLSKDGADWQEAVGGELQRREGEQYFILKSPADARFVRLELLSNHGARGGAVRLGTFKVIADPTAPAAKTPVDLAAAENGGYAVWSSPPGAWTSFLAVMADQRIEGVLGFHMARAARIEAVVWADPPTMPPTSRVPGLTIYTSTGGPLGPWTKRGVLAAPGRLTLPPGTSARYVRVVGGAVPTRGRVNAPLIAVHETPAGAQYRSVLGEWGPSRRASGFERSYPAAPAPAAIASGNQSKKTAAVLGDSPTHGRVHRGKVEDWYRIKTAATARTLVLHATGGGEVAETRTLDVDFELLDARGGALTPRKVEEEAASSARTYEIAGGQDYFVRVWQPPSSVVFSWDTSGSVASWVPLVVNAVHRFAETVTAGQEQVHLLPFGGGPLLIDWEDRPEVLARALAAYRPVGSSESEKALSIASGLLRPTRGAKAVVLLTDALSPVHAALWADLEDVRPRIFAAGVGAGVFGAGLASLVSWAAVASGYYEGITNRGQLDVFFERASAWLREPASYAISAILSAEPVAPPGTISVIDDGPRGGGAVEFVVDVSGSMLDPMRGGGTRIEVARRILGQSVEKDLPAGTSAAVRVFGRVAGDACGTELKVPVGPASAVLSAIPSIDAKKYAMTPIASALKEVAADLAGVKGSKTVVLLTDGRETCGGDPAAVLRDLAEKGLDIRVNIVGFALSSASLKRTFADLAEVGGGQFYDASDAEGLASVLSDAVRAPFVVKNGSGVVVARGTVGGGSVALPPGRYQVEVATAPLRVFEDVEVQDGKARTLLLSTR